MCTNTKSIFVRISAAALFAPLFCNLAFAQQIEPAVHNMPPKHSPFEADKQIDKVKFYSLEMIPANRAIWAEAQADMKQDLELLANQLNVYLSTAGIQESAAGRDIQLRKEVDSFRSQVDKLIKDSTMSRSRVYWQGRLNTLKDCMQRVSACISTLAPNQLVLQKWQAIQSDYDRMSPCVY